MGKPSITKSLVKGVAPFLLASITLQQASNLLNKGKKGKKKKLSPAAGTLLFLGATLGYKALIDNPKAVISKVKGVGKSIYEKIFKSKIPINRRLMMPIKKAKVAEIEKIGKTGIFSKMNRPKKAKYKVL